MIKNYRINLWNNHTKGKHSLDKWTPPLHDDGTLAFDYEDAAIYENLVAIGQPDGTVTVVDLDGKLHAEIAVYEDHTRHNFRWCDVLMNKSKSQSE